MKRASLLCTVMCILGIMNTNAQSENINWDDYISDGMAQKLKRNLTNGLSPVEGGQIYELFMLANNITSLSDFAVIMDDLTKHKEYAAKFILEINSNFVCPHCYFQTTVGFTWEEIGMAKVAGVKMQEMLEIQQERAIIAEWNNHGKDTATFSRGYMKNRTTHPQFVFYIKNGSVTDTVHKYPLEVGDWRPDVDGDKNIQFIVGENGVISDDFRKKVKQYGMDSICVLLPAKRGFKRLDTVIAVPSKNYFGVAIHRNEMHKTTTSYVATLKYDKKTGRWMIMDCKNKYVRLKDWFDQAQGWIGLNEKWTPKQTLEVDSYETLLEWMNSYFNDTLKGYDGKKVQITFTFIPKGNIRYFINGCLIGKYKLMPNIQIDNVE